MKIVKASANRAGAPVPSFSPDGDRPLTEADRLRELAVSLEPGAACVIALDSAGRTVYASDGAARRAGHSPDGPVGPHEPLPGGGGDPLHLFTPYRDREIHLPATDQWFEQQCLPVATGGMLVVYRNITRRKRAEQDLRDDASRLRSLCSRLAAEARTDALTGLANRRAFDARLEREWRSNGGDGGGGPLSLLLCDLDWFKAYNDACGHLAGDGVLRTVAKLVANVTRGIGFVCRYGGEEFAVLLPRLADGPSLEVAEAVRHAVATEAFPGRAITISIGAATRTALMLEPADLLDAADVALYQAKRFRNRVWPEPANLLHLVGEPSRDHTDVNSGSL